MKIKVLRNYKHKSAPLFGEFCLHLYDCLVALGAWPIIIMAADLFKGKVLDYNESVAKTIGGNTTDTANRTALRAELTGIVDQLADWADKDANGDAATIVSYGFEHTDTVKSSSPLATPSIKSIKTISGGRMKLLVIAILHAHGYEVQVRIGEGPWVSQTPFQSTRNMILQNLVPGTNYQIRVRAVGGSLGFSEWSAVFTQVCT